MGHDPVSSLRSSPTEKWNREGSMPYQHHDPEINALHHILHWCIDNWQFVLFVLGGILGSITWALRSVFATKGHMNKCKSELSIDVDSKLSEMEDSNTREHGEIRADVRQILNHLLGKD